MGRTEPQLPPISPDADPFLVDLDDGPVPAAERPADVLAGGGYVDSPCGPVEVPERRSLWTRARRWL